MQSIEPTQTPPQLKNLFNRADLPAVLRFDAVLQGVMPGKVYADDPIHPTWAVVRETVYGTLYLAGEFEASILHQLVNDLKPDGDVLYGFWEHDQRYASLFPEPQYVGEVVEFTDRPHLTGLDVSVPSGCEIHPFDLEWFPHSEDYTSNVAIYGSVERALEHLIGYFLVRDGEVLSEASAGTAVNGVIELGVSTREKHRRKGYAMVVCSHLVYTCEQKGYQTYWNCSAQNIPSVAIARKLGYRDEKRYKLFGWF